MKDRELMKILNRKNKTKEFVDFASSVVEHYTAKFDNPIMDTESKAKLIQVMSFEMALGSEYTKSTFIKKGFKYGVATTVGTVLVMKFIKKQKEKEKKPVYVSYSEMEEKRKK